MKDSRVTRPPPCFPISPRSEILRHSRPPTITFVSPPGRFVCSPTLARAESASIVESAEQEVGRESVRRDAVAPSHGAGRQQCVQDRLLASLRRGVEERRLWTHHRGYRRPLGGHRAALVALLAIAEVRDQWTSTKRGREEENSANGRLAKRFSLAPNAYMIPGTDEFPINLSVPQPIMAR